MQIQAEPLAAELATGPVGPQQQVVGIPDPGVVAGSPGAAEPQHDQRGQLRGERLGEQVEAVDLLVSLAVQRTTSSEGAPYGSFGDRVRRRQLDRSLGWAKYERFRQIVHTEKLAHNGDYALLQFRFVQSKVEVENQTKRATLST